VKEKRKRLLKNQIDYGLVLLVANIKIILFLMELFALFYQLEQSFQKLKMGKLGALGLKPNFYIK